ncbi:nucleoside triphosphate pyrophosphohydrolase ham1 [Cadophora gregata f. sp. sojae]|nr:nucleoside triphosphate pyrophosphohydrolase ham1 [Cadophora gregata f. sp. sojae]
MAPKQLNFITGNKNKLTEVKAILGDTVDLKSQALDLVEIQGTIEEISADKCRRAAAAVNGPVLVEDTCLCFNALKELPGPYMYVIFSKLTMIYHLHKCIFKFWLKLDTILTFYSKWFLEALGHQGLNDMLAAFPDKSAQAVCTFAYCEGPSHEPIIFQGRTHGKIVPARGPTNFGWDPIFEYEGKTYAEMDKVEKNKISHRFRALEKLKKWMEES